VTATDAVMKFWFVRPRLIRAPLLTLKLLMSSSALGTSAGVLNRQRSSGGYTNEIAILKYHNILLL
jgi:hypothetical protein